MNSITPFTEHSFGAAQTQKQTSLKIRNVVISSPLFFWNIKLKWTLTWFNHFAIILIILMIVFLILD